MENGRRFNAGIIFTYLVLIGIGIAVMYRIVHLSVSMGKYYEGRFPTDTVIHINNRVFRFEEAKEMGKRGDILLDDGTILLATIFVYDLYWYPSKVYPRNDSLYLNRVDSLIGIFHRINPKTSMEEYAKLLKTDYLKYREDYDNAMLGIKDKNKEIRSKTATELAELRQKKVLIHISNTEQPERWARQRDMNEIDTLFKGWKGGFRGGCHKDPKEVRRQLAGGFPSSVLGTWAKHKGEKHHSFRGIEGYYDTILAGELVSKQILKVNNVTVRQKKNQNISPKKGKSIVTTINKDIQRVTRDALKKRLLEDPTAAWGCALVMEVKTGQIKAIVNLDRHKGGFEELTDHATTESFEPGSTFKLITLLAALEAKVDTAAAVKCEKGTFSLKRAFAISDNEGMYHAAKMGYANLKTFRNAYLKMGLQNDLHIETAHAKQPKLSSITDKEIDYKNVTHGYSIKVPPVYMLAYYNAVANKGVYIKPTLIKAITSPHGEKEEKKPEIVQKQICSPQTIRLAQACLEAVVMEGTARRAQDDRYKTGKANQEEGIRPLIAGKTGTAYIYDEKMKDYSKTVKNSSFIGYFPADNPMFTCLVLISKTHSDAAYVAVPVCKEIAEKINDHYKEVSKSNKKEAEKKHLPLCGFAYRKDIETVYKGLGIPVKALAAENKYAAAERSADSSIVFRAKEVKTNNLSASLRNATAKDAAYILEKRGYKVLIRGVGKVSEVLVQGKMAVVVLN
jgi:cell division protein FtsI (penicillin-binding protein 3)